MSAAPYATSEDDLLPQLPPEVELVVLARTLWREGYDDHLGGHITMRQPEGWLLCTPWLLTWEEFGPDDVICIDREGNRLAGAWPVPPGIPLHLALHRHRDDVEVALHHHPRWGTVWADARRMPTVLDQSSALGGGELALVEDYSGAVNDRRAADEVVVAMGGADMALLNGHGVFVLGGSVRAVHQRAVALEWRCRMAWHVEALGGGEEIAPALRQRFGRSKGEGFIGFWEAMARRELRYDASLAAWRPERVSAADRQ